MRRKAAGAPMLKERILREASVLDASILKESHPLSPPAPALHPLPPRSESRVAGSSACWHQHGRPVFPPKPDLNHHARPPRQQPSPPTPTLTKPSPNPPQQRTTPIPTPNANPNPNPTQEIPKPLVAASPPRRSLPLPRMTLRPHAGVFLHQPHGGRRADGGVRRRASRAIRRRTAHEGALPISPQPLIPALTTLLQSLISCAHPSTSSHSSSALDGIGLNRPCFSGMGLQGGMSLNFSCALPCGIRLHLLTARGLTSPCSPLLLPPLPGANRGGHRLVACHVRRQGAAAADRVRSQVEAAGHLRLVPDLLQSCHVRRGGLFPTTLARHHHPSTPHLANMCDRRLPPASTSHHAFLPLLIITTCHPRAPALRCLHPRPAQAATCKHFTTLIHHHPHSILLDQHTR